MPVYSFLEEYNLGTKTIIPFVTHGGSSFSDTRNTISELQPGAFVSDNTFSLSRNNVAESRDEIRQWAESLNLNVEDDMPDNQGDTVAKAIADPQNQQTLYLWEEGALDLARAVRFVRKNAAVYEIDEKNIAVMGFSAGGILAGEMLLNFDGTVNGTALDEGYAPDELDGISADAAADGMIYSFYGRLSVASKDAEKFAASDLPPTYFCYGTRDPFVREFEALHEADKPS